MFIARKHFVAAAAIAALFTAASAVHAQVDRATDQPTPSADGRGTIDIEQVRVEFNRVAAEFDAGHYDEAVQAFPKLANMGWVPAMFATGVMYHDGKGVARDDAEALRWFMMAAQANNPGATTIASYIVRDGAAGVVANPKLGFKLLVRGAMLGNAGAQLDVGAAYTNGNDVVDQDLAEGYAWTRLAADAGNQAAVGNLRTLRNGLDANEVKAGEARAATLAGQVKSFRSNPTPLQTNSSTSAPAANSRSRGSF